MFVRALLEAESQDQVNVNKKMDPSQARTSLENVSGKRHHHLRSVDDITPEHELPIPAAQESQLQSHSILQSPLLIRFSLCHSRQVGVTKLRSFLEARVEDCYRRNVAKIVPLLQRSVTRIFLTSLFMMDW